MWIKFLVLFIIIFFSKLLLCFSSPLRHNLVSILIVVPVNMVLVKKELESYTFFVPSGVTMQCAMCLSRPSSQKALHLSDSDIKDVFYAPSQLSLSKLRARRSLKGLVLFPRLCPHQFVCRVQLPGTPWHCSSLSLKADTRRSKGCLTMSRLVT